MVSTDNFKKTVCTFDPGLYYYSGWRKLKRHCGPIYTKFKLFALGIKRLIGS